MVLSTKILIEFQWGGKVGHHENILIIQLRFPGLSMGMSFLWDSHGTGWDRHKLLRDGNGKDKYVPWTTLAISIN